MPLVMTVLMWTFPVDRRGTAMGVFGIVIAFAPAAGPTVAGIIIDQANWHVMFWIIAVLCASVIVFAAAALERGGETNKDVKLDVRFGRPVHTRVRRPAVRLVRHRQLRR